MTGSVINIPAPEGTGSAFYIDEFALEHFVTRLIVEAGYTDSKMRFMLRDGQEITISDMHVNGDGELSTLTVLIEEGAVLYERVSETTVTINLLDHTIFTTDRISDEMDVLAIIKTHLSDFDWRVDCPFKYSQIMPADRLDDDVLVLPDMKMQSTLDYLAHKLALIEAKIGPLATALSVEDDAD